MIIAGDVKIGEDRYVLAIKSYAKKKLYIVYSITNLNDPYDFNKNLVSYKDLAKLNPNDYLLGAYSRSLVTGEVKSYGDCDVIRIVLDNISYANNYVFADENIVQKESHRTEQGLEKVFEAADKHLALRRKTIDGELSELTLVHNVINLKLQEFNMPIVMKNIQLVKANKQDASHVLASTIKTIRLSDLDNVLDMSWYHTGEQRHKHYDNAKSVFEFETKIFTPIIKAAIKAHQSGTPLITTLDTETSGLYTFNLAEDNPTRSHCVSIQLSWEEDQGIAIFNDMEHFQNVSIEYVLHRLKELFEWYKGTREVEYWDTDAPISTGVSSEPKRMLLDATNSEQATSTLSKTLNQFQKKTITIARDWFFLVGHNAPFDRRTCYQTDHVALWFDADTLQMAFDINPQLVRGNKKLKLLTRKFFGHETPELTDILGRGNEDKYRYLVDEEVANVYGCADVDYTRKSFFVLRHLMTDKMWHQYLKEDVDLPNILAISEYYGMMTYPDKVVSLAEETAENINILKEAAYSYVGAYQDYTSQRQLCESAYSAGICTREEYLNKLEYIHVDPSVTYRFDFKASALIHVLYEILHYPIFAYTDGKIKKPKVDKYVMNKLASVKRKEHSTARKLERDILCYGVDRDEYDSLLHGSDADKKKAAGMRLISAEEFNSKEYPLALLLQEFASLNKEYTSYYKPILEENLEGKLFKSYNMARIETRRIANPGQTMKANLKALVRSYDDDHYVLDFDMSQVEYRIMLSLAGFTEMIEKMKNPERDYHTETASMVNAKPAHKVTKYERKHSKSVSFGVPYGLGERSLCEKMFGDTSPEHMVETRITLDKWRKRNKPIMDLLEGARAEALEEWKISDDLRNFMDAWQKNKKTKEYILDENGNRIPIPLGRVTNKLGFYRVFNLTHVGQTPADKARRATGSYTADESSIRRKAGNFPIQSFAAEVFRTILTRFYWRCVKEGIEDKIIWHMLIHDELLCSVHKSLHPMYIYKLVKESCMVTMQGHTKYFVGINIGDTWAECKDDAREAPVFFVQRMIDRWDAGGFATEKTDPKYLKNGDPSQGYWFDHPWEFIKPLREQYVQDRIGEVIRTVIDIDNGPIDIPTLLQKFDNYTVRAYVNDYTTNGKVDKEQFRIYAAGIGKDGKPVYDEDMYEDAVWASRLETWALTQFPEGKEIIDIFGNVQQLERKNTSEEIRVEVTPTDVFDSLDEIDELEELLREEESDDTYWSFDDEQLGMAYEQTYSDEEEDHSLLSELNLDIDGATSINDYLYKPPTYQSIQVVNNQLRISYSSPRQLKALQDLLAPYSCSSGYTVIFKDSFGKLTRWIHITTGANLSDIDTKVAQTLETYSDRALMHK